MSQEVLLYNIENGVARITLNRPDKYNSFTQELAMGMQDALDHAKEDETVRAILITGAGKAFCAGQDLAEVTAEDGPTLSQIVSQHLNPIIRRIAEIEKPVLAAVNGVAAGAGASLAIACDIAIAAESATFIQAFSKIGLVPDTGATFHLPRLIGYQRATALMMLGDKVSAAEAAQMGMIYRYFPDDEFQKSATAMAERLAQMPTRALGLTKRALHYTLENNLETQLAIEDQLQSDAGLTEDYKEGVSAFLEKRKPRFVGK